MLPIRRPRAAAGGNRTKGLRTKRAVSDTFTITDLATEFKVTPRAIRFYEDKDLLHPLRQGMARVYSRRDRGRLALILRGKRLGFSLAEIREMLDLYDVGDGRYEQMRLLRQRIRDRLVSLERQRRDINDVIKELKDAAGQIDDYLETCEASEAAPAACNASRKAGAPVG